MQNTIEHDESSKIDEIFDLQRDTVLKNRTTTYRERRQKLRRLLDAILEFQDRIESALKLDLNKCAEESRVTEIIPVLIELQLAYKKIPEWMQPKRVARSFPLLLAKSSIKYEPRGRVLVISPWNYPFNLSIIPVISALAAGNTVVLKPSEISSHTSSILRELITNTFDEDGVAVIEGDADTAQYLIKKPFDHIFFTGSPQVGKLVMALAAENLSTVTLELGGKSPAIVGESADLKDAAHKIAWGKFINAGQTCIAPDYVLVPDHLLKQFVELVKEKLHDFLKSNSYTHIISDKHYTRLTGLLEDAIERGASIESLGENRDTDRYFAPVIITDVDKESAIMQEEIFGPLLTVIPVRNIDEAIAFLEPRPKPLTMYVFGRNREEINKILTRTTVGSTCINETLAHFSNPNLPFGGVNNSGTGRYHGFHGFEELSHKRGVFKQSRYGMLSLLYPPYTKLKQRIIDFFMWWFSR